MAHTPRKKSSKRAWNLGIQCGIHVSIFAPDSMRRLPKMANTWMVDPLSWRTPLERNLQNGPGILVYNVVYTYRYSHPILCADSPKWRTPGWLTHFHGAHPSKEIFKTGLESWYTMWYTRIDIRTRFYAQTPQNGEHLDG